MRWRVGSFAFAILLSISGPELSVLIFLLINSKVTEQIYISHCWSDSAGPPAASRRTDRPHNRNRCKIFYPVFPSML